MVNRVMFSISKCLNEEVFIRDFRTFKCTLYEKMYSEKISYLFLEGNR